MATAKGLRRLVGNDCTQIGHHYCVWPSDREGTPRCWGCRQIKPGFEGLAVAGEDDANNAN